MTGNQKHTRGQKASNLLPSLPLLRICLGFVTVSADERGVSVDQRGISADPKEVTTDERELSPDQRRV